MRNRIRSDFLRAQVGLPGWVLNIGSSESFVPLSGRGQRMGYSYLSATMGSTFVARQAGV